MTTSLEPLIEGRERFLTFVRQRINDPGLAEDVLQSSMLKAVRSAPALRDEDALVPWFYTILRNAITDAYREQAKAPLHVDVELAADVEDDEDSRAALCTCIEALIPALKPEYRETIESLDIARQPSEAVASRLGVTPGNLKVRHHRARQALRRSLEETCRVCAEHHCLDCTCKVQESEAKSDRRLGPT